MSTVTERISEIKQPDGGYVSPELFDIRQYDDGKNLYLSETLSPAWIGLAVDYITRYETDEDINEAFRIPILGAEHAEDLGYIGAVSECMSYLRDFRNAEDSFGRLSDESVINACKAIYFDAWCRDPNQALRQRVPKTLRFNQPTIRNIRTMVQRSLSFLEKYGPVAKYGFTFETNGYTDTVDMGDGDFLTHDTLWDFKTSRNAPDTENTLQIAMYWIMGMHSGKSEYESIDKIGIFNPRLNAVFTMPVSRISREAVKEIEEEVICYQKQKEGK